MATPRFITDLRELIGTRQLWLPGVSGVVIKRTDRTGAPLPQPQVLLVKRSDDGKWTVTSGILEPGEDPAPAAVREIEEETGVIARALRLAGVWAMPAMQYPNGDQCRYLDTVLEMEWVSGEPRVNDDESSSVGWFSLDSLPEPIGAHQVMKIEWALDAGAQARFLT